MTTMFGPRRIQTRLTSGVHRKTICGFVAAMCGWVIALDVRAQSVGAASHATTSGTAPSAEVVARLELTLPAGCGTQAWFVDRVRVRSDKIRFRAEESSLVVDARISPLSNGRLRATMALRRRDGTVLTRTIQAGNCQQAIDALALVTAVTLDPSAVGQDDERKENVSNVSERNVDDKTTPQAGTNGSTTATATTDDGRNSDLRRESPPPPPTKVAPFPEPVAPPAPVERDTGPIWALDLSVLAHRGAAPGWLLGAEFGVGVAFRRNSIIAPSVRLGVAQVQRSDVSAKGGLADFTLSLLTVDGCPLSARLAPLELRACALLEVGRMATSGHETVAPEQHHRLWLAPGAGADLSVRLARHWSATFRGRSVFPLVRDTYQFAPEAFHDTPITVLGVQAGLSYRFR